jgi:hypothetical protein
MIFGAGLEVVWNEGAGETKYLFGAVNGKK